MARSSPSREGSTRGSGKGAKPLRDSVLERLSPNEAQTVLDRLLTTRADLRVEAERIARGLLGEVSFESVADDVEDAICALDLDDLGDRAGRHRGGYTSPTDAAWELLHEAVDPFLSDMKRQMELGLEGEALEICKGILLGLYRVHNMKRDEFLGWAEDFPTEAAADAVSMWRGRRQERQEAKRIRRQNRPIFPPDFIADYLPEWDDLIAQASKQR
jgi:hypothetical protein